MNKQQEPRLRFKGFSGAWEEKKIGEILSEVRRSIYLEDSEKYQLVTVKRRNEGVVSRGYLLGKDILVKNYSQLKTNDYLISKRQIIHGANGIVPSELDNAIVSNEYLVVVSNNDVRTEFLTLVSRTPSMYLKFLLSSYGVDIEKMVFNVEDWKSREITLPSLPEQTHLGLFFRRLDSQIAESRAVLEKSRQLKKAMLAKMFPTNGEKIPEIRFKGFDGEWESRKLGIEVEIIGGGTPDTTNSAYWNGDIDWYSPTEIGEAAYANGSVKKITLLGLQKSSAQILPANRTVLFTSRASIGDMAILTRDGATNQGFQSFVVGERLDVYFLYTMGFKLKDYALKNASGSTFLEISKNTLSQMEFFAPSLKEQTAIGNFFRQLDETIALQTAEVEKLNQLKKGLLAAMLV